MRGSIAQMACSFRLPGRPRSRCAVGGRRAAANAQKRSASKVQQAQAEATMEQLERKAQLAYEQDVKDAQQTKAVIIGSWVRRSSSRACSPCLLASLAVWEERAIAARAGA